MFNNGAELVASIDSTYGGGMGELVLDEFLKLRDEEWAASAQRQRMAAQRNHSGANHAMDGLGQRVASIDGASYFYWQNREPGCWDDPQFLREYLRDNPAARVPYTPKQASILVPPTKYSKIR